jgi:chemotaxis protein CheD
MNRAADLDEIFLEPGGFFFGGPDTRVRTLLGSCVAMTLWHPQQRVGGIAHFMLPSRSRSRRDGEALDARYADEVIELFCRHVRELNTTAPDYEVKLFGGANMFPHMIRDDDCSGVSCRNVQAARRLVDEHGFWLKAEHLGGVGHRSLIFDLRDGVAYLRHGARRGEAREMDNS